MKMDFKLESRQLIWDYLLLTVGALLTAFAFAAFFVTNDIAPGGVSGIAIVLNYLFGTPVGTVIFFTFFASAQLRLSLFDAMEDRPGAFAHALSRQLYETPDARALFLLATGSGYNL